MKFSFNCEYTIYEDEEIHYVDITINSKDEDIIQEYVDNFDDYGSWETMGKAIASDEKELIESYVEENSVAGTYFELERVYFKGAY